MRARALRLAAIGSLAVLSASCGDESPQQARPAEATTTSSVVSVAGTVLLVCLSPDATRDDVQALFDERTSTPSATGTGTDLVDGIVAVALRTHGIAVELTPEITSHRRDELIAMLEAPPVVSVDEGDGDC